MRATSPVHSFDEFTRLREVIVGTVDGFSGYRADASFMLGVWDNLRPYLLEKDRYRRHRSIPSGPRIDLPTKCILELREDLESLVDRLTALGVTVRRPQPAQASTRIQSPFWTSVQSPPLNIRDQTMILGTTIVETAPQVRARIFENDFLKPIFQDYYSRGANWVSMPRPALAHSSLDGSYFRRDRRLATVLKSDPSGVLPGLGFEMAFDGAQCIRLGRDVLVNVANENHRLGLRWLEDNLGACFRFHALPAVSDGHVDSDYLPLRRGLWLIRKKQDLAALPTPYDSWDYIVAPENKASVDKYTARDPTLSSKYLDMNVLSVDERTVVANSQFPGLVDELEANGFRVVQTPNRHGRLFGGGFHCFTLDVRRDGGLSDYSA